MRKVSFLVVTALVALALVAVSSASQRAPALGPPSFLVGATDDHVLGQDDGGAAMYDQMTAYGLRAARLSVEYRPSEPTTIQQEDHLQRAVGAALDRGFRVMLSIGPSSPTDVTGDPKGPQKFAAYAAIVARRFPAVRDFIIGNEPNLAYFWAPTYNGKGAVVAARTYLAALAASYDALKAVDPDIDVVGLALSPRGSDRPGNIRAAVSPVRFIRAVGDAYRASRRRKPIMDNVALHPYPNNNLDPPERGYSWPNIGAVNLDRAQQAFWDAFHGTAQPTFQENGPRSASGPGTPVRWILDEAGWQTNTQGMPGYKGLENVSTVDEATQARYHAALVRRYACDPRVTGLLFFHWIDESDRDRFQSGVVRANNTLKPGARAVRDAIDAGCTGARIPWRHSTKVDGASATWRPKSGFLFFVRSSEEAAFTATATPTKAAVRLAKVRHRKLKPVVLRGLVKAYVARGIRLRGVTYGNSRSYTFKVKIAATMNPARAVTVKAKKLRKPDIEL